MKEINTAAGQKAPLTRTYTIKGCDSGGTLSTSSSLMSLKKDHRALLDIVQTTSW